MKCIGILSRASAIWLGDIASASVDMRSRRSRVLAGGDHDDYAYLGWRARVGISNDCI
jgi:hypothetical protein